ncbi:MAG: DUF5110 domain-containing protein [Dysgonamonadaceae bacterium]|jgi:alpha-D-xyloside xylohydrolase|nr:DUF5110 domain-containing protein [Dysgonamonadaceae bacterium]
MQYLLIKKKNRLRLFCLLTAGILAAGQVRAVEQTPSGIRATVGNTGIDIRFYSPQMVRVIKGAAGKAMQKESLSVIKQAEATPFSLVRTDDGILLKGEVLAIDLNLSTGNIRFSTRAGQPLLSETAGAERSQTFLLDKEEAIYGLGQQQEGRMNRRGESLQLFQENTRIAIPFFHSVKGYGVFWDNYSATQFTDSPQGTTFSSEAGDGVDYYFLYGKTMDGVIACMRDLTGQVPLYPLWAWGYWQSKERYASQKELVGTLARYRELGVPLDGIIQDWQYWSTDNAYWNSLSFGNPEFPDPKQMMDDIHRMHAHAILSVWPSFGPKTQPYRIFKERGMLLDLNAYPQKDSARIYDAFHPEARAVYWDEMNRNLFAAGIDGWWLDATEPDYSGLTEAQLNQPTAKGPFREFRNAYPLMSVRGVYEQQRQTSADKRVYILTRSAFAGQQRYASTVWSGDIDGDWEVFRKQIPAGLNFSLCGLPYWNTDIGGFWVRDGSSAFDDYRELYVRWLQFGAFCPMMRSHGSNTPREIWHFGEKGDWAYDAIEKYIRLRYLLLPYHYSLSWEVSSAGGSILRHPAMDFPDDKKVWDLGSEYLYGRSILVVPVTRPFYAKGKNARSTVDFSQTQTVPVYLPEGAGWYDFWTEEQLPGGTELQRETPVDLLPLYIKAGSILPCGEAVQYTAESNRQQLTLKIYPGKDAEFVLYEDENDGYNYEKGLYSTIPIRWEEAARTLTIGDRQGGFPGMPEHRYFHLVQAGSRQSQAVLYSGTAIHIKL